MLKNCLYLKPINLFIKNNIFLTNTYMFLLPKKTIKELNLISIFLFEKISLEFLLKRPISLFIQNLKIGLPLLLQLVLLLYLN